MPVLLVIPARLGSTRLPRKPLQNLGGEPLVARVVERARTVRGIDEIVVATDSEEIERVLKPHRVTTVMTSVRHESGTDRIAEVAQRDEYRHYDIVVNLQGDEPDMPAEAVHGAVQRVVHGDPIGTAASPLEPARRDDPARVKVVLDANGCGMYFSRSAIPHLRDAADAEAVTWWQHLGVYAYRRDVLLDLTRRAPTMLERAERLEQLRALDAGYRIGVALLDSPAEAGIDTPDDLAAAQRRWQQRREVMA